MKRPIALTLGEPSGIGGEISLKAWQALKGSVNFLLLADHGYIRSLGDSMGVPVVLIETPSSSSSAVSDGLPLLHHPLPARVRPGLPDPRNAAAVVEMIRRSVELTRSGEALAVCTNPINKKALHDGAGFGFPGHTEYLAHLCGAAQPVMMLAAPALRVVPVTIHVPLASVPGMLTQDLLESTIRLTHDALISDFGIFKPRIAVAGLNPHAGEGGAMGTEEITVIEPVVSRLRSEGMEIRGPSSADTMFHPQARATYDVAVCMYHDQALIPLKTLDFSGGVNITLGLDFVRTSPDHGTALDIAGKGCADPSSLIAALHLAGSMGDTRANRAR